MRLAIAQGLSALSSCLEPENIPMCVQVVGQSVESSRVKLS